MTRYATAIALLLSTSLSSYAQTNIDHIEDEIIGYALHSNKINALKTPTLIIDVPQSLSILSSVDIEKQAFTNIGDVTRYTPGINISQGEGHRDSIIIRGNQSTADFYQDGLRDDVQYFRPLYNVEQVEILRGPNALLFGRGGVGGIINRVTKKANTSETLTQGSVSIDTFGSYKVQGDSNYVVNDDTALRVTGFYEQLDNHRDFFEGERFGFNPTATFKAGDDTTINLSYEYLNDDRVVDRGVTSTLDGDPRTPIEGFNSTFFGSPEENNTTLEANILRGHVSHNFNANFKANFMAQYADYDKAYQNLFPSSGFDFEAQSVELDGYRDITDRENLILQANLIGEFDALGFEHTLLFGAEYTQQDTTNQRFDNVFASTNDDRAVVPLVDGQLFIPDFAFSDLARDRQSDIGVLSIYVQDEIDLHDKFKLLLGGRFDQFDTDVINNDSGTATPFTRTDEEISPRLGAIYKPQDNISIYAGYSETFLPRSGDQFLTLSPSSANTDPQKTENLEAGIKWDIQDDLSLTAAIFDLDRSSVTTINPDDQSILDVVDGVTVQGVEVQLSGHVTEQVHFNLGYSYLDGDVQDLASDGTLSTGNKPRQTPEHTAFAWGDYQLTEAISLGLGATYQDSYFAREGNRVEIPSYVRFDASAAYDVSDNLRLQVNLENLTDTRYFPDAHATTNISTGKPFNARFTVSGKF